MIVAYCIYLGFALPNILINKNIFAINPTTIAVAVTPMTHAGSGSDIIVPSDKCFVLHRSAQPEIAINVNVGPSAPHIIGVMLAQ